MGLFAIRYSRGRASAAHFVRFTCLGLFALLVAPSVAEAQFNTKPAVMMSRRSGKCARVLNGSTSNGTAVRQETCRSAVGSTWRLTTEGGQSPYFKVVASHSGQCLAVQNGSTGDTTPVVQNTCAAIDSQRWTLESVGQYYRLRAKHSNKCVNVNGNSEASGATLIQWPCQGGDNELWAFGEGFLGSTQRARLVSNSSNFCVDVSGASGADNAAITQWGCHANPNQKWSLQRSGDAHWVRVQHSNKCLAVSGDSTADNAAVVQLPCTEINSRRWNVQVSGSNYTLVNRNSNRCLDIISNPETQGSSLVQRACNGTATQVWRVSTQFEHGTWSALVTLPLVPVAAAALSNNKVLFWSSYDNFANGMGAGFTKTALYDPQTGTTTAVQVSNTQHDMFCPGTAMLADGRVLVNGGANAQRTSIYNAATQAWTSGGDMNIPRGYNADATLDNGKVFTIGGSWSGALGGKNGEIWTAPSGGWANLPGTPGTAVTSPDPQGVYRGDNHPWLFATGNGKVFHAGPGVQMNWFDTAGSGSTTSAGNRGADGYSMNGNAVMYDIKRIVKLGGAPAYQNANAVASAYTINLNSGVAVTPTGSLAYARAYHNSVVLPDGRVFAAGGQSYPIPFSDSKPILASEIWSPTSGAFNTTAADNIPRTYHSVSLLLPDARVLVGGGGLCGNCDNNHADFAYYSPDYLFDPNGLPAARPSITSAPTTATYNTAIGITTSATVTSFSFVRLGSVTHSVNNDQRRIPAAITTSAGNTYTIQTPSDSGVATPGFYMLFALNGAGVPSTAAIVRIQ